MANAFLTAVAPATGSGNSVFIVESAPTIICTPDGANTAQEWYILGKDEGVSGDNTIIFAANPIATGQKFNSDISNKNDENL